MMAAKQINYASIFGSYVMKKQYQLVRACETEEEEAEKTAVVQETVEDYIEQA